MGVSKRIASAVLSLLLLLVFVPSISLSARAEEDTLDFLLNGSKVVVANRIGQRSDGQGVYLLHLSSDTTVEQLRLASDTWFITNLYDRDGTQYYKKATTTAPFSIPPQENYFNGDEFLNPPENNTTVRGWLNDMTFSSTLPTSNVTGFVGEFQEKDSSNNKTYYYAFIQFDVPTVPPSITVDSASGKPGDTVTVPVTMANSPEFASFGATLTYNGSALELTALTAGELKGFTGNPATGKIGGFASENYTLNGTICTATFKIKDSAAYGEYDVGLDVSKIADVEDHLFTADVTAGKITVSAGELGNGYNVFMDTDKTVAAGADVDVAVGIAGQGEGFDKYTNYTMKFRYDDSKLEFIGVSGVVDDPEGLDTDKIKAEVEDGVITVRKYGTQQISSETGTAFTLQFKAKTAGTAEVKCTGAGIGNKGTVEAGDEIAANLLDDTTMITVAAPEEYAVSISTGDFDAEVTGAGTATAGQDYSFTVADPYYDYTFTATIGENTVTLEEPGEDGKTYTIPGAAVNGPITITLTTMTPKTYEVTVKDGAGNTVTNPSTVDVMLPEAAPKYTADYVFTVTKAEGYVYAVSVTVGGETVELEPSENDETHVDTYTIAGADVKGDVVITVVKTVAQDVTVEFIGSGKDKVVNGTPQTAKEGKDFTFTVNEDTVHYDYTVTAARGSAVVPVTPGESGAYTIAADYMTAGETPITVTVTETRNLHLQLLGSEYVKLDGKVAVLLRATAVLFDNEVLVRDNIIGGEASSNAKPMYYTTAAAYKEGFDGNPDGVWLYLISMSEGGSISSQVSNYKDLIKAKTGDITAVTLNYDRNVNMSPGGVDTNDAQLVWNMYNAQYELSQIGQQKYLLADTNQDMKVNVLDSGAIVDYIINGTNGTTP